MDAEYVYTVECHFRMMAERKYGKPATRAELPAGPAAAPRPRQQPAPLCPHGPWPPRCPCEGHAAYSRLSPFTSVSRVWKVTLKQHTKAVTLRHKIPLACFLTGDAARHCREKISVAKAHLEFKLDCTVEDNKRGCSNMLTAKGGSEVTPVCHLMRSVTSHTGTQRKAETFNAFCAAVFNTDAGPWDLRSPVLGNHAWEAKNSDRA